MSNQHKAENNSKKGLGIRGKFLLMTLLPVLGGFVFLGLYSSISNNTNLQNSVGTTLKDTNDGFSLTVAQQLEQKAMIPKTIATSTEFRSKNETAINQTLLKFMENYNITYNLYVAYQDEIKILGALRDNGVSTLFKFDTPADEYRNDPNIVWYYPVEQMHEFCLSVPYFDTGYMKIWMVSLIAPLFDMNNSWDGLTGCDIGLNTFQTAAKDYKVGVNGFVALVSPAGTIIAYPDESKWGQPLSSVFTTGTFASDVVANGEQVTTVNINQTEYTVQYQEVSSLSHWKSIVFIPTSEIYDPIFQSLIMEIVIMVVAALVVTVFVVWTTRRAATPIAKLSEFSRKISAGDLTQEIKTISRRDEVGSLWNDFTTLKDTFSNLVRDVQHAAYELSEASEALVSSSEEVSSSSENVASTQQQITKGAQNQAGMVVEVQRRIQELSDGIKNIKTNADQITQVVDLITSIANQTNLLALNAAIEAARAGEAGRGFSVVADQVRKLADESKQAVKRTESMATQIMAVSDAQAKSTAEVVGAVDTIATVAEETSASTEEASAAAEEQASAMEEITSTAQSLATLAENLRKIIGKYDLGHILTNPPARFGNAPPSPPPVATKVIKEDEIPVKNFTRPDPTFTRALDAEHKE